MLIYHKLFIPFMGGVEHLLVNSFLEKSKVAVNSEGQTGMYQHSLYRLSYLIHHGSPNHSIQDLPPLRRDTNTNLHRI